MVPAVKFRGLAAREPITSLKKQKQKQKNNNLPESLEYMLHKG